MNINLTPVFEAIIALIAALVTYKLIPWIRSKTTAQQQANLEAVARMLVFAAEQIYGANKGEEKFRYVQQELAKRGYDIDPSAIEAAVARYLNYAPVELVMEASDETNDR